MQGRRIGWLLLVVGLTVGGAAGLLIGAELMRRWPWHSVERVLERYSLSLRPISPWSFRARAPHPRYEAMAAVVDGRVFVFGGFDTPAIEATARVDEYDPVADKWARRADMPVAFTHANAAVLDGEIWFAGGFLGDHPGPATDHVWRYAPATDAWLPGPSLPAPRGGGGLAVAPDGALHYFGGWLPDRHTDSEDHWRLAKGAAEWVPAAPLPSPRGHFGTVSLGGLIYAIGGTFTHDPWPVDTDRVHRYDPSTDRWEEVAALPEPRSHLEPSTFVHQGRIFIAGGRSDARGEPSADEIIGYDPATDTWSFFASLPRGLLAPVAVPLGDELFVTTGAEGGPVPSNRQSWAMPLDAPWSLGPAMPVALGEVAGGIIGHHLYLVGWGHGGTLVLNVGTGEWLPLNAARHRPVGSHHAAAEVYAGELYVLGGLHQVGAVDAVQIYSPATDTWRYGPRLPAATGSAASAIIGDYLYLAGGITLGDTTTRQMFRLDPRGGGWEARAPMPRARNHAASATDGRRFYVFGGRGPGSGDSNILANGFDDVQIYDPETDTWVASGVGPDAPLPLPQARGGMGKAVYVEGEFYIFGGETLDGPGATAAGVYDRVDIYDPLSNQWREGPPLPTPRHGMFPLRHGPWIWVPGGGEQAAWSFSSAVDRLTISSRSGPLPAAGAH